MARASVDQTRATRASVLVVAGAAFVFWLFAKTTLVGLLLIAYNGITQLFPGVALSFLPRRPSSSAVGAGIGAGILVLVWAAASARATVGGVNVGLAALAANAVTIGVGEAGRRLLGSGNRHSAQAERGQLS